MANCGLLTSPDTYAATGRRFRQISGAQSLCSRLLCGVVHSGAVHEQGITCIRYCLYKAWAYLSLLQLRHVVLQALFTTFQFHFPITVALAQMVVMVPVCYVVAKPRLEWATAKAVFPLAVVNILNVVFGLVGRLILDPCCCNSVHLPA